MNVMDSQVVEHDVSRGGCVAVRPVPVLWASRNLAPAQVLVDISVTNKDFVVMFGLRDRRTSLQAGPRLVPVQAATPHEEQLERGAGGQAEGPQGGGHQLRQRTA